MIFLPSPTVSCYFLLFPAISCMSCCFLQFPVTAASCYVLLCLVISYDFLLVSNISCYVMLGPAISCYFFPCLAISQNSLIGTMICTDLQAAHQLQITANHMICRGRFSTFFRPLICTDLQLICKLQITANQSLPTFKKHCKTRANQRKSLQITPPKNHRKNDAELQPNGVLDLVSKLGGRKANFVKIDRQRDPN